VLCTHSRMCSLSGRDRGNIPVVGPSFLNFTHNLTVRSVRRQARAVARYSATRRVEAAAEETVTAPSQTGEICVVSRSEPARLRNSQARTATL